MQNSISGSVEQPERERKREMYGEDKRKREKRLNNYRKWLFREWIWIEERDIDIE